MVKMCQQPFLVSRQIARGISLCLYEKNIGTERGAHKVMHTSGEYQPPSQGILPRIFAQTALQCKQATGALSLLRHSFTAKM